MIMNYVLSVIVLALIAVIGYQVKKAAKANESFEKGVRGTIDLFILKGKDSEEEWRKERQQLLDRIQAPSYDVMKHHEVKIIKAKNNEKEPEKLEVM